MSHGSKLISDKKVTISVLERRLLPPAPGKAAPRHDYTALFTVRASVRTSAGTAEFARVEVNGKRVSHTFTIRWTSIPFDSRHRIRDVRGNLYDILTVSNVNEGNKEIQISTAMVGNEAVEAAR